jgi:antitoxin component of MazEF toxin-antitoxin module
LKKDGLSSAALVVPADWLKINSVKAGDSVELDLEDEFITIRPIPKMRAK